MHDMKQKYNIITEIILEALTLIIGVMMIVSLFVPVYKAGGENLTYIGTIKDTFKSIENIKDNINDWEEEMDTYEEVIKEYEEMTGTKYDGEYDINNLQTKITKNTVRMVVFYVSLAIIGIIMIVSFAVIIVRMIQAVINLVKRQKGISTGFSHILSLLVVMLMTKISAELAGGLEIVLQKDYTYGKTGGYWTAVLITIMAAVLIGFICNVVYKFLTKKRLSNILLYSFVGMVMFILLIVAGFSSMGTVSEIQNSIYSEEYKTDQFIQFVSLSINDYVDSGTKYEIAYLETEIYIAIALFLIIVSYMLIVVCIQNIKSTVKGKEISTVGVICTNIAVMAFTIAALVMNSQAGKSLEDVSKMTVKSGSGIIVPLVMNIIVMIIAIGRIIAVTIVKNSGMHQNEYNMLNGGNGYMASTNNMPYNNAAYQGQINGQINGQYTPQNNPGGLNNAEKSVYQNPLYRGKNN